METLTDAVIDVDSIQVIESPTYIVRTLSGMNVYGIYERDHAARCYRLLFTSYSEVMARKIVEFLREMEAIQHRWMKLALNYRQKLKDIAEWIDLDDSS